MVFSVPVKYEKKMREYTRKGVERKFPYCDYHFIPVTAWNYGFAATDFEIKYNGVGDVPFSQENPPVTVKADLKKISWGFKFPFKSVCDIKQVELCPYGCTRLRMTEMPLV